MRLRRLGNLATLLSLALCVVAITFWARSFWVADAPHLHVRRSTGSAVFDAHVVVESARGRLVFRLEQAELAHDPAKIKFDFPDHVGFAWGHRTSLAPASFVDQFRVVRIGSDWRPARAGRARRTGVALPYALPVALLGMLPIAWWRRRRNPPRPGHCAQCGYDLRGTPTRCPECGATAPAPLPPQPPPPERTAATV